jgi:UDP-sugar diphosphatase
MESMSKSKSAVLLLILFLLALSVPGVPAAASAELFFTVLHTNDEHSALLPTPLVDYSPGLEDPSFGGFARLAQAVTQIRAEKVKESEPVLLLSAGDYLGGSPFSWLAPGGRAPELSLMVELGYDVITIGNHEYDYGPDVLAQYLLAAGYPAAAGRTAIVATNTVFPENHALSALGVRRTWLQKLDNGLTIGYFGLIGKRAIQDAAQAPPVTFAVQTEAAREAVAELKQAGADIIIAITHSGVDEDTELARSVPGINLIVGGHCHTALSGAATVGETLIVQTGDRLRYLGVLELAFNPSAGKLRLRNPDTGRPILLPLDHNVYPEPGMAMLVDEYTRELDALVSELSGGRFTSVSDTIVYTDFVLPDRPSLASSPFGNFVTDAMRLKGEEVTGEKVHFAFQANGVIRGALIPGSMPHSRGRVSFFDLASLVGLGMGPDGRPGNPLVSVYFTGEEIRRILEVSVLLQHLFDDSYFLQASGLKAAYDLDRAVLFTIPVKNIPVPSTRAVLSAEMYAGTGIQGANGFLPLKRGDSQLYHVVTDYYLGTFLPMVGELLPSLALVMKDRHGNPVELDDTIIKRDGNEYKVWQAVLEYAAGQPKDGGGRPRISEYYRQPPPRLTEVGTLPLLLWPALGLLSLLTLIIYLIRRGKRRRRERLPVTPAP